MPILAQPVPAQRSSPRRRRRRRVQLAAGRARDAAGLLPRARGRRSCQPGWTRSRWRRATRWDELAVATAADRVARLLSLAPRHVKRAWAGLRTFAPDRVLVVGEDPLLPGFFWLAGQGGCGSRPAARSVRSCRPAARRRTARFDASLLAPGRFAS
ncbi:MAG: hypothetical protein U0802_15230 [Candidatus Binatia bacterium]